MKKTALAMLLLFGAASATQAQTFKDGPHFGVATGGDVQDENLAVGWQAAYEFNDYISLELTLTRLDDDLRIEDVGAGPSPGRGTVELETWAVPILTARIGKLLGERAYLYAGAGIGYYFFSEDTKDVRRFLDAAQPRGPNGGIVQTVGANIEDDWGVHLALGCEWHLWNNWELFAEYRHVYFDSRSDIRITEQFPNAPFGTRLATTKQRGSFDYDHGLVRVGVNYRF